MGTVLNSPTSYYIQGIRGILRNDDLACYVKNYFQLTLCEIARENFDKSIVTFFRGTISKFRVVHSIPRRKILGVTFPHFVVQLKFATISVEQQCQLFSAGKKS